MSHGIKYGIDRTSRTADGLFFEIYEGDLLQKGLKLLEWYAGRLRGTAPESRRCREGGSAFAGSEVTPGTAAPTGSGCRGGRVGLQQGAGLLPEPEQSTAEQHTPNESFASASWGTARCRGSL